MRDLARMLDRVAAICAVAAILAQLRGEDGVIPLFMATMFFLLLSTALLGWPEDKGK